ncbi:amino acid transporter [Aspergillus eucalypticola CBS 122712]|uniref:Amino acid transporter n=1 Tax=Aspergillus eucalypticola (strain CBS 122712 / IBT 29274) TaxID=1448314 RepID=A0A317V6Z1_ASPEC|nr:amino acid transporter [Aspergillus eucalypticola CBS 122712]PWY70113.1 amino acid transporter [Aspergillus eucalypticola CBS 122712]
MTKKVDVKDTVVDTDLEKTDVAKGDSELLGANEDVGYHRSLGSRQIMMMTFGAGVGTGLWVGTGTALKYAGPGGIAVAYTITAFIVYLQYTSIGEMTTFKPVHGGFIRQCIEYVEPAFGFAVGVNFWFSWVICIPAEITAAVSVLEFWPATEVVPLAAYITIFLVVIAAANCFGVRIYGHVEYIMSFVKILAIFVMIFFMFIMTSGGIPATHGPIEFRYWRNPGAFNNGIKGISKAFVQALFSFGGGEHIAVIAGEAKDPRRTIKRTVYPVFWRMFSFFVVNIWLVGMCVPYDDENLINGSGTLGSPFVIAIERAGVMWLAHIINGFIFLTVISCGITSAYVASRSLAALSDMAIVHPFFGRKDTVGRPYVSLALSLTIGGALCYLNCSDTGATVYGWFSSLVSVSALFQWSGIFISHIRFRQGLAAQGIDKKTLPFRDRIAPYAQYLGLVVVLFIAGCEFYLACFPFGEKGSAKSWFSSYIAAPLFFLDYFGYKIYYRSKLVRPSEMDFSAAAAFDEEDRARAAVGYEADTGIRSKIGQYIKNLIFG